jgi:hypothetical protein
MVMAGVENSSNFTIGASFIYQYHLAITVTNEAYSGITNVDYCSTDGNSQLLNRVQMVILNF